MRNFISKKKKIILLLVVLCFIFLVFEIHIFSWNKSPIYLPKETKSITVNASDESLDASLFVYTSDAIEVKLVDASKYVYEPIIKKKGKKKEFEFWYLKPGAQYTLITKNNKNTVVFEQIAIKDVLSSIS